MTTPALQAKVRIRQAWFEAHPPADDEDLAWLGEINGLLAEVESGAVRDAEQRAPVPSTRVSAILAEIVTELGRAIRKHPPIHSPHEGYAVLLEEVEEYLEVGSRDVVAERIRPPLDRWWLLVKADQGRTGQARAELVQIAAMAMRTIIDLDIAAAAGASARPATTSVPSEPGR